MLKEVANIKEGEGKMIKNIIFAAIAVMLTVLAAGAAFAATDYGREGVLKLTMVNQEPDPAEPNSYFDIRLKAENLGLDPLSGVLVEYQEDYPFSMDPGSETTKNIGTLEALQRDDRAIIIKYKIRVDKDAVEGTNKIRFRVKSDGSEWSVYEFDVDIRTTDATLAIESITSDPPTVQPGKDTIVQIKVKNIADSTLKDISLKVDLLLATLAGSTSSATAASTTTLQGYLDVIPFAPVDSGTEKKINQLNPGEEAIFTYKFHAYPTAESRVYKVPIYLTYYDSLDTAYTKNDIIGLVVNSEPDIRIVLEESTIKKSETSGKISVKFINKGLTNVKFLDVTLIENKGADGNEKYDILSSSEVYVGKIDSDDYETADFEIFLEKTADKTIFLPLHYEYMDANNNKYSKDIELELNLGYANGASGSEKSGTAFYVMVTVIVLVAGLVILRLTRKKK